MATCNNNTSDHTHDAAAEGGEEEAKVNDALLETEKEEAAAEVDGIDNEKVNNDEVDDKDTVGGGEEENNDEEGGDEEVEGEMNASQEAPEAGEQAPEASVPQKVYYERRRKGKMRRRRKLSYVPRSPRNNNCHSPKAKVTRLSTDVDVNGTTANGDAAIGDKKNGDHLSDIPPVKQRVSARLASAEKRAAELRETRSKTRNEIQIKTTREVASYSRKSPEKPQTIIVTETKSLAQVINNAVRKEGGSSNEGKPTLVIIETKSPAVDMVSLSKSSGSMTNTITVDTGSGRKNSSTTLTPVSMSSMSSVSHSKHVSRGPTAAASASTIAQQLTPAVIEDGGMAVEVPSLVVPYLIEYPPSRTISEFLKMLPLDPKEIKELEEASKKKSLLAAAQAASNASASGSGVYYAGVGRPKSADRWGAYFESSLGKFFSDIGLNLAKEWVQTDLVRSQQRKAEKEGRSSRDRTVEVLMRGLNDTKEKNEPYHFQLIKCVHCNFKTESIHVMNHHYDFPHERHLDFRCNFCSFRTRIVKDIIFHMEAEHGVHAKVERPSCFYQCPMCDFEDNSRAKVTKHTFKCVKKFVPERNLAPPSEFDPPAKRPKVYPIIPPGVSMLPATSTTKLGGTTITQLPSSSSSSSFSSRSKINIRPKDMQLSIAPGQGAYRTIGSLTNSSGNVYYRSGNMVYSQTNSRSGFSQNQPVLMSGSQQYQSNQIYQVLNSSGQLMPVMGSQFGQLNNQRFTIFPTASSSSSSSMQGGPTPVALVPNIASSSGSSSQRSVLVGGSSRLQPPKPNISITPVTNTGGSKASLLQPRSRLPTPSASMAKLGVQNTSSFVVCEICDGYIKDLEQLRTHMQWIHKVKIHPKMIFNRPPLNCQKCQFRFFTDQGLERHLLGAHGLVTSSMQENANKGQDSGRCTICGKVFQWKLLAHMSKDHSMILKPAHLSYKCTVCAATFGMYKLFETHVYQAHSTVAKRVLDAPDENKKGKPCVVAAATSGGVGSVRLDCSVCGMSFAREVGDEYLQHWEKEHLKPSSIKLCRVDECLKCLSRYSFKEPFNVSSAMGADDDDDRVECFASSDDNSVVSDAETVEKTAAAAAATATTTTTNATTAKKPDIKAEKSDSKKSVVEEAKVKEHEEVVQEKKDEEEELEDDEEDDEEEKTDSVTTAAKKSEEVDEKPGPATESNEEVADEAMDEDDEETALDMEVESHDVEHPSTDSVHTDDDDDEEILEEEEQITPVY